jgi:hypothetical protein
MSGRVRVDLKSVGRVEADRSEYSRTQRDHLLVRSRDVVDVEIEVDLLLLAVRPVGRDVVWRELETQLSLAVHENSRPVVLKVDGALEKTRPKRALGREVGSIEHGDASSDLHSSIKPQGTVANKRLAGLGRLLCVPCPELPGVNEQSRDDERRPDRLSIRCEALDQADVGHRV